LAAMVGGRGPRGSRHRGPLGLAVAGVVALASCSSFSFGFVAPSGTGERQREPTQRAGSVQLAATATAELVKDKTFEAFEALTASPVRRGSDGAEVSLTSLWSEGDRVVVAFLRHFG